jgi:hypothetical protein
MFDQLQQMMSNPQALDTFFGMMSQKVAQESPEKREALGRVKVTLERTERSLQLAVGRSDNLEIEQEINQVLEAWTTMLARGFQSMGFRVEIVD